MALLSDKAGEAKIARIVIDEIQRMIADVRFKLAALLINTSLMFAVGAKTDVP